MKKIILLIMSALLTLGLSEILLWFAGYEKYEFRDIAGIKCSKEHLALNQNLGYCNKPGHFQCSINNLQFSFNHLPDSSRRTSKKNKQNNNFKDTIHVYGGSVTWGHGLNDPSTMAWIIQEALPKYKVKNYGIGAGSIVQSYLWLKRNVDIGNKPNVAIINYSSFHDERNALSWSWQKAWQSILKRAHFKKNQVTNFRLPYARIHKGKLAIYYMQGEQIMRNLPLVENSVIINLFNNAWHNLRDNQVPASIISHRLGIAIQKFCNKHDIKLLINGITNNQRTQVSLKKWSDKGVLTNNIAVDMKKNQFNLSPYDRHPNKLTNQIFAYESLLFLCRKGLLSR